MEIYNDKTNYPIYKNLIISTTEKNSTQYNHLKYMVNIVWRDK